MIEPIRERPTLPAALLVLLLVAVALVLAPATATHAVAQAGPVPYVVTPGTLATTTGPADAEIPVALDYDLYVPATATAATPQPAIVVAHGFGNDKSVNEVVSLAALFASNGYVVLTSTHQGFGGSSGCVALDSVDYDGRNVASLIDLLADRPDVLQEAPGDPVVGMVGGSYGGGHQAGVAAIDDRVDALSPGRTWHSLQYALVPNNLITTGMWDLAAYEQGVFKTVWTSLFFALAQSQPLTGGGGCDPLTQQTLFPGQPPCPGLLPAVCPLYARLLATGESTAADRALVARSSASTFLDDVDVPVLLTQGQADTLFTPTEALATYERLRARGVDARIILNDGGHGYAPQPGEGEPYGGIFDASPDSQAAFAQTTFARRYLGFFGHHLRGQGDPGPRVSWFRSWVGTEAGDADADAAYADAAEHPVAGVRAYLLDAGTERLLPAGGPLGTTATTVVVPANGLPAAHSETPNFTGPGQPGEQIAPSEVPGQHVAFDGPVLEEALESVGVGTARVHLTSASGSDVILFAKLYDVAPDGTATLIRRMTSAVRVPAEQLPGFASFRLPPIAHRFEAGHRVRFVLATTDDAYRNAPAPDVVTISTGGDRAVLLLPAAGDGALDRIEGRDRIDTAVQLSQQAFDGGAPAVVVTAAGDFPDALAAGGLAAAAGGPLLLTDPAGLPDRVAGEVRRLAPRTAYVVGGTAAVGPAVQAALAAEGIEVVRLAGPDRFATAAAVATETARLRGGVDRVVLARGDAFADALAAGSLSATGAPVLLATADGLPAATRAALAALDPDQVIVAGGTAVIDAATAAEAGAAAGGRPVLRLGGPDRYDTARQLVEAAQAAGAGSQVLLLASGATFADALAAAPAAHALRGVLMTVDPQDLGASRAAERVIDDGWPSIVLVGGYGALGQALDGQVAAAR